MTSEKNHKDGLSVCVLASGSKGNAVFVSQGPVSLLVDAGLSGVEIERRMASKGLRAKDLDGILVSHEHSDHIRGVGVLSRRFGLPVHMTRETERAAASQLGRLHEIRHFDCGSPFDIGGLGIRPFSTSHDAADPAGFTVRHNGTKIGIATDMGVATAMVRFHLKNCDMLILEANHDPDMLIRGPYPWPLKQRIRDRTGHLSNEASRDLLGEIRHEKLSHVILAHLSESNNTPRKALNVVGQAIRGNGCRASLTVARQDVCGELFRV